MKKDRIFRYESPIGLLFGTFRGDRLRSLSSMPAEYKLITGNEFDQGRMSERLREELDEYFRGKPIITSMELDLTGLSGFYEDVYHTLRKVEFGRTITYGELANRSGHPRASRAVGTAMKMNPFLIIVPCHRVLASGSDRPLLGGFSSGLDKKRYLLRLEGHVNDIRGLETS